MRFLTSRWRVVVLTIGAALWVGSCNDSGPIAPSCTVTSINVTATPASVKTSGTSNLTGTVLANSTCGMRVLWSVSPAGGTLTPTDHTATFSATTPNTFTITVTSVDDATKKGTATVAVTT